MMNAPLRLAVLAVLCRKTRAPTSGLGCPGPGRSRVPVSELRFDWTEATDYGCASFIKYSGQGSRSEAAQLGETTSNTGSSALKGRRQPLHIDRLRVYVPAGYRRADLERLGGQGGR